MPRSKNPDNYPTVYFRLFERALVRPEGVRVEFADKAECLRNRNSLYAYLNALEARERKLLDAGKLSQDNVFATSFRKVKISFDGPVLFMQNRDFAPDQQRIEAALEAQLGPEIATEYPDVPRDDETEMEYLQRMSDMVHNQAGHEPEPPEMPPADDEAAKLVAELFGLKTPTT